MKCQLSFVGIDFHFSQLNEKNRSVKRVKYAIWCRGVNVSSNSDWKVLPTDRLENRNVAISSIFLWYFYTKYSIFSCIFIMQKESIFSPFFLIRDALRKVLAHPSKM